MANNITIQSFNQLLGAMIRKIIAETPVNDINAGSVLLSLLEACANNDFENNTAILNILELLNVDALTNNDLDNKAADLGLTRNAAVRASGQVSIFNKNIVKRSTNLYIIKPPPISGQTVIFVNDASAWAPTGTLYIGRGTDSFEGPISYTSITNFTTYFQINLASALQNDHLSSDLVIDAQGQPDRLITSGTLLQIPSNNFSPAVLYSILQDVVIPAGEDTVTGVSIIAQQAGSLANASIGTIIQFVSPPFTNAGVTNPNSFSNGSDVETDTELRNRIKGYATTLARGTAPAIISAIIGVSDPNDNKQVASAVIAEPIYAGAPSIMYIDDGSGFQPSEQGQTVDTLLTNASGKEEFLQLANYPLPRPQVINTVVGPFALTAGMNLNVAVDSVEESIQFKASDFLNISAATVAEIVVAINSRSTIFKARFTNNSQNILIYPVAFDAEVIQVMPLQIVDDPLFYANNVLKFPTNEHSYIALYQNSTRLHEKEESATLNTAVFSVWNIITNGFYDLIISVDGTPAQDQVFTLSDFPGALSFADLTVDQWVIALNNKFAGITATATPAQTVKIVSNKSGAGSSLVVEGGSILSQLFPNLPTSSVGQGAQFQLNRQTGNLRILTPIVVGDNITAGVADAKGFVISSPTLSGLYNVSPDGFGRPAIAVVVADAKFCDTLSLPIVINSTITVSDQGAGIMRIMSDQLGTFESLLPGDFLYITPRTSGWLSSNNTGLFRSKSKGPHLTANVDSYIEVWNSSITTESTIILAAEDIAAFRTDGYPQVWDGIFTANPAAATISDIINTFNIQLTNVIASTFRSNSIKLTSTTELNGSIAIPVSVANASVLFKATTSAQLGTPPLIANRVSSKDLFTFFKRSSPVTTNVWLGREIYDDIKGPLSAVAQQPDAYPFSLPYSEQITATGVVAADTSEDDEVFFTRGDNKGQFRSIAAKIATDQIGTQQGTARTAFDHIISDDEIELVRPLEFAPDDSIVFIMDEDPSIKTVDVQISRTGLVNSGNAAGDASPGSFTPTSTEFSATDFDNEPGIDFGNLNVWGKILNHTEFSDYAVWMRARNWYSTGGVFGGGGQLILRANEYGPGGNNIRFAFGYPELPLVAATNVQVNTPSYAQFTHYFGSGPARSVGLANSDTISVTGPYPDSSTNFPAGAALSGNYYDITFSAGTFVSVQVGDVLGIQPNSGISSQNRGQFSVVAVSGNTVRVFNPAGSVTAPGGAEVTTFTTVADIVGSSQSYSITVGGVSLFNDAKGFALLAGTTITNTGASVITGDVGVAPGSAIVPGAWTLIGTSHSNDTQAINAEADALAVYNTLTAHSSTPIPAVLDNQTLIAGYYDTGAATLDGGGPLTFNGSATDIFVVKTASTLITGTSGTPVITLTGGAVASNIYWVVGSSATINSGFSGTFQGNVIALTQIGNTMGGTVNGRLFALNAAVNLNAAAGTVVTAPAGFAGADSLDGTWFKIYDTAGAVGIWFDVNSHGTPQPAMPGVSRAIKIATVLTGDTATVIATKIYQYLIQDGAFNNIGTSASGNIVIANNTLNGFILAAGTAETSGFTMSTLVAGVNDVSLNGKYFTIWDNVGPVAVWFDVGNNGTSEPLNNAYRSIRVSNINFGDSAATIAAAIAATINSDASFSASSSGSSLIITTLFQANVPDATVNTSGFTLASIVQGSLPGPEVINNFQLINFYPLTGTDVATIAASINLSALMTAVPVGNPALTITKSTSEENSTTLGFGHNPTDPYVGLYDGEDWVKTFKNENPNFTLKRPLVLNTAAPSVYQMNTAPNPGVASLGEFFKLMPTTVKNVYHHLTQKALSQLPIIANISISDDRKNVQIDSKQLGSAGAIEVVGGRANSAQAYIIGDSQIASDINGSTLLMKIPAFPDTFSAGDTIKLTNDKGVQRKSSLILTDKINVVNSSIGVFEYHFDPKVINVTSGTMFDISDVSGTYGKAASTVWRWHFVSGATFSQVKPGDILYAFGTLTGWNQGNKVKLAGDESYSGLPIVGVSDSGHWVDVVNPYGVAMSSTAVGFGTSTVQICPSPVVKWNLKHAARVSVASIVTSGTTATVTTIGMHMLNVGDLFTIQDSNAIADSTYTVASVTGPQSFTLASVVIAGVEGNVSASVISSTSTVTRYRIEKLGYNGMTRLSRFDGNSPGFADCGVAVDDYMIIGGNTFVSNDSGTYRVAAVDNNSVIFENPNAIEQLDTTRNFNLKGLQASWVANSMSVTGVAGTFKYVNIGDWVKKPTDSDKDYVQVVSFSPSTPALATTMTLGSNYVGKTSVSGGVAYNEMTGHDKGVYLLNAEDIQFFEGDSLLNGDSLTIQNFVDANWFNINNTGTFLVSQNGTDPVNYTPFIRVNNPLGIVETNRLMSVDVNGLWITENNKDKFYSIRQIQNEFIDDLNIQKRSLYISPASRDYKFSQANLTSINAMGKLGYSTDVTTGVDGYLYYTGLLRRAQRIIDGFEPDSANFPGRRAIGGRIEILPPLIHVINLIITVTTNEGINLGDISNNIKSVIINYISNLGVGENVIMSEIVTVVQGIKGVATVNLVAPTPDTQFIAIANNEKATIQPNNIGIA